MRAAVGSGTLEASALKKWMSEILVQRQVRIKFDAVFAAQNLAPWEGRPWFKYPLAPGELGHEGWQFFTKLGAM